MLARYFNLLRFFFLGRVPNQDIEDLIQEVFVRMTEALHRFEGRSSVRTFMLRIARNVVLEIWRKRGCDVDTYRDSLYAISGESYSQILVSVEEHQWLLDAMQHISLEHYDVLEHYYFHDLTTSEVAELLDIPAGTVKSRLRVARESLLRVMIERLGVDAEAWSDEALARGLTKVRDEFQRARKRKDK